MTLLAALAVHSPQLRLGLLFVLAFEIERYRGTHEIFQRRDSRVSFRAALPAEMPFISAPQTGIPPRGPSLNTADSPGPAQSFPECAAHTHRQSAG